MNTELWNLFWTTGMPEAWLMSRNGEEPAPDRPDTASGTGPLAFPPGRLNIAPGGPERMY